MVIICLLNFSFLCVLNVKKQQQHQEEEKKGDHKDTEEGCKLHYRPSKI